LTVNQPSSPTYPSFKELTYATRLKHFATHLPAYASRYQLSLDDVIEVQCLATEFIAALTQRIYYTTAAIQQPRHPTSPLRSLADEPLTTSVVYRIINELVGYIRLHPAYLTADGCALCLADLGEPETQVLSQQSSARCFSPTS
jgi:hypothetical protein